MKRGRGEAEAGVGDRGEREREVQREKRGGRSGRWRSGRRQAQAGGRAR